LQLRRALPDAMVIDHRGSIRIALFFQLIVRALGFAHAWPSFRQRFH
jgi:hypothetical protein